jgi:hypothetical protein
MRRRVARRVGIEGEGFGDILVVVCVNVRWDIDMLRG